MNEKMWIKIFIFLWVVGTTKYNSTPIPNDCAKRVLKCPVEREQWLQGTNLLKCANKYGYVCLRDSSGNLLESCMANFTIQANTSNCPILIACKGNKPILGTDATYYNCPEEVSGCPPWNHAEYSIYQLYKYPKCIQSNFAEEMDNTSSRSTTPISITTISSGQVRQEYIYIVIAIAVSAFLLTVVGCIVCCSRQKMHGYVKVEYKKKDSMSEGNYGDLRRWILSINESEADRIRILPLKEYDTIEVDKIYVPLSIVDDFEMHTSRTTDKNTISELTPDKMFYITPDKPARFIFMLGDAGYGKTVQCRRLAKSWCKAWKAENAQHDSDVKFINLEYTKVGKLNEWEKSLKDFEFLFYVQMRDVHNENVSVNDMIYDYYRRFDILQEHLEHLDGILNVLKDKKYKCLIILDGLDEWNMSESKKGYLPNKGIPNCQGMFNCTFLITMRSWKFMEIDPICRQGSFTNVLLLHGLGDNGIEELTTNMLCSYFNVERHSNMLEQSKNLKKKASLLSRELRSLMRIPLIAVFFILTWHENIETGDSLTTFYISMIEALIKRSQIQQEIKFTSELSISLILKNFPYVSSCIPEISNLCKLAFKDLDSRGTTFVLTDVHLKVPEVKETVDLFLRIGLLIKHDATGQIHEDNARFSFLHKTIQDFIYTLYLVYDRSETEIVNFVMEKITDIEKTLELATVLTFISGLSPAIGCKVSSRIAELTSADEDIRRYRENYPGETYYKVFLLYSLQLSCYREVRGGKSIGNFQENGIKFSLSDIILIGYNDDRLTIRETADVLRYHASDIKSLCMKCIPDDNQEGITNDELKTFLQGSKSLMSLNIDCYDRGKCRLLNDLNLRVQGLTTLGLHNVAFSDNILAEFLAKEESKRNIKALGLFDIKPADDLLVDYEYRFPSAYFLFQNEAAYLQRRTKIQVLSENISPKENRHPLLNEVLQVLPSYYCLSTLHVSYMESDKDRQMLLQVLPEIKTLQYFGYDGSSIYKNSEDDYDNKVIKVLLEIKTLRKIYLAQISLKQNILNFRMMTLLEDIELYQFQMKKQSEWLNIAKSLSNIETLSKVVLCDTNIDEGAFEMLNKSPSSRTVVRIDCTEWQEY